MYDFGTRLKTLRKQRGLTQKVLAEKINKSVSAVSSYELNVQIPPVEVLVSIAYALGVSLDYLVGIEQSVTYSSKNLNTEQQEIFDLLYREFLEHSNNGPILSLQQIDILRRIILVFTT